jgi:glycosyltransferase involved in cell wall biosynthesis
VVDAAARKYVLITAAYNERSYLGRLADSVVSQTVRPLRWIIVDDASTDGTAELASEYARRYPFIECLQVTEPHARNFQAHIVAINLGYERLRGMDFAFVGNLDADIAFGPEYFASLLRKFDENPALGIGGGALQEDHGQGFRPRGGNTATSVANGVQCFRRECYDAIGGYKVLKHGAPDWNAEVCARMHGWWVESFDDLAVQHLRPTGTAGGRLRNAYRGGLVAYSMGSHPLFELFKCARRWRQKPLLAGSVARMCGLAAGYVTREERAAPPEQVRFLRDEQMVRLRAFLSTGAAAIPRTGSRRGDAR